MKLHSLTALTKNSGISLNAASILSAIIRTDLAKEVEYLSTTGSGEIKKFVQLTNDGLRFGDNKETLHEFKTEPRFYAETFPELLSVILGQLRSEIDSL